MQVVVAPPELHWQSLREPGYDGSLRWVGGWVGGWERVGGWGLREGMHRRLARLPPARLLALPWIVCHGAVAVPLRCTCACSGEIRTPLHGIAALPMGERRIIAHRYAPPPPPPRSSNCTRQRATLGMPPS